LYLVLTPDLNIAAVSEAYLKATMTKREEILGRGLFEIFPDNPDDSNATGAGNLRASLERVLNNRMPDTMAVQKYDIRRPESEGSGFEERYWSPVNSPILMNGEVAYVIHRVEDVTEFVRLKQAGNEQHRVTEELRTRASQMEAEVLRRSQQLQTIFRNPMGHAAERSGQGTPSPGRR
jgi:PAS domain-containing protein